MRACTCRTLFGGTLFLTWDSKMYVCVQAGQGGRGAVSPIMRSTQLSNWICWLLQFSPWFLILNFHRYFNISATIANFSRLLHYKRERGRDITLTETDSDNLFFAELSRNSAWMSKHASFELSLNSAGFARHCAKVLLASFHVQTILKPQHDTSFSPKILEQFDIQRRSTW